MCKCQFIVIDVSFGFSSKKFFGKEDTNGSIALRIVKEQKVRLANPLTIRITPMSVEDALENGISYLEVEDHLSPSRATGMTDNTTKLKILQL